MSDQSISPITPNRTDMLAAELVRPETLAVGEARNTLSTVRARLGLCLEELETVRADLEDAAGDWIEPSLETGGCFSSVEAQLRGELEDLIPRIEEAEAICDELVRLDFSTLRDRLSSKLLAAQVSETDELCHGGV